MKSRSNLVLIALVFLSLSLIIEQSYSQLTFSNDWSGGRKRSPEGEYVMGQEQSIYFILF